MTRYLSRLSLFLLPSFLWPLEAQQAGALVSEAADAAPASVVSVLRYGNFAAAEGAGGIDATTFAAQMRYTGGRALGREGFAVFVAVFLLVVIMVAIRRRR